MDLATLMDRLKNLVGSQSLDSAQKRRQLDGELLILHHGIENAEVVALQDGDVENEPAEILVLRRDVQEDGTILVRYFEPPHYTASLYWAEQFVKAMPAVTNWSVRCSPESAIAWVRTDQGQPAAHHESSAVALLMAACLARA